MTLQKWIARSFAGALLLSAFGLTYVYVSANALFTAPSAKTAVATTSAAFLSAGQGTTTVTYDSYGVFGTNQTGSGNTSIPNKGTLLVQFAGSSTASVLNISYEFSDDGIDWYKDNIYTVPTSTPTYYAQPSYNISWTFASSTVGGVHVSNANSATSTKAFSFPVPTRYVRAVFTIPAGASAGRVWAQMIPLKERYE